MSTSTITRFLKVLSSITEVERGRLYQLIQSAEASYYLRDINSQRAIGLALQSFAYPFNQVGKYYESMFLSRTGQHQKARQLLESVAESAPSQYRSKALLSLSGLEENMGRFEDSIRFRLQVLSSDDQISVMEAQWGIAALRSLEGDHRAALRDLERYLPLAQIIGKRGHPAYTKFLNSYAIELSESVRTNEAEQAANVIAASPLLSRYPEWQDTLAEIDARRKRSSMITVPHELNLKYRDARVGAAVDFMNANYHRKIVLADITKAVNLSTDRFTHIFRIETGFTPIDYLIRLRLEKASRLLKTSFLSVKEIMAAVGYNNKGHFARQFKRRFSITPSEYRSRFFNRG